MHIYLQPYSCSIYCLVSAYRSAGTVSQHHGSGDDPGAGQADERDQVCVASSDDGRSDRRHAQLLPQEPGRARAEELQGERLK